MTSSKFLRLCRQCEMILRRHAPIDTGNLRHNAIRLEMRDKNTCVLYVDETIAPYMKYTNEPWEHKNIAMGNFRKGETVTRFRTWDNPNEHWFDDAAQEIAEYLARTLKGELS